MDPVVDAVVEELLVEVVVSGAVPRAEQFGIGAVLPAGAGDRSKPRWCRSSVRDSYWGRRSRRPQYESRTELLHHPRFWIDPRPAGRTAPIPNCSARGTASLTTTSTTVRRRTTGRPRRRHRLSWLTTAGDAVFDAKADRLGFRRLEHDHGDGELDKGLGDLRRRAVGQRRFYSGTPVFAASTSNPESATATQTTMDRSRADVTFSASAPSAAQVLASYQQGGQLPAATPLTVDPAGTLDLNGGTDDVASLSGAGVVTDTRGISCRADDQRPGFRPSWAICPWPSPAAAFKPLPEPAATAAARRSTHALLTRNRTVLQHRDPNQPRRRHGRPGGLLDRQWLALGQPRRYQHLLVGGHPLDPGQHRHQRELAAPAATTPPSAWGPWHR